MTEALAMPPGHHEGPWTIEEVLAMPFKGDRHELFQGRLVTSPVPPPYHQNVGIKLIVIMYGAVPAGFGVSPETNLRIDADLFIPDVVVARAEALSAPGSLHLNPEDVLLVGEILSPGNTPFDRAWKAQRYAEGGIPFSMEVEISGIPRVTVYELRGKGYVEIADAHAGETLKLTEPFELSFDPGDLVGPQR